MYEIVQELLQTKQYVEFLVERVGNFEILAGSVIRQCKKIISVLCVKTDDLGGIASSVGAGGVAMETAL